MIDSLRQLLARSAARRVHARPTREGVWFLLLLGGVVIAAVNTGNNLLYIMLGSMCSLLVLSNLLAEWNLRGLSLQRRLPAEVYAGQPASGAFRVENRRRFGASAALRVSEQLPDGVVAHGLCLRVSPGAVVEVPARWTLPRRGPVQLDALRLASAWPFGLMERWRDLSVPAELLVYPGPLHGQAARRAPGAGPTRVDRRRRGGEGELLGLRPYVPGDPLRDLHWPTSARAGQPMVVVRSAVVADEVVVEVEDVQGPLWEHQLGRATGQLVAHFRRGQSVGLRLLGRTHPPRPGDAWRRHLLALLALAPRRERP